MLIFVSIVFAYLIGAVSFSYLITKALKNVDIRKTGSGNAGATNTLRVLGVGPAVVVLMLDIAKGIAAILIARAFGLPEWAVVLSGLFAIIGHDYPVYFGFKGGKGVATTIGIFFMIMPLPALVSGVLAVFAIALTRYVSVGSLLFLLFTPIIGWIAGTHSPGVIGCLLLITALAFFQHRGNLVRLFHGTENKIGKRKIEN